MTAILFGLLMWPSLQQSGTNQKPAPAPPLSEVISNITSHEKALGNFDAKWIVEYKLHQKDITLPIAIRHKTATFSSLIQGKFYRNEVIEEGETVGQQKHHLHWLYAYDGTKTRYKVDDIINVQDSLIESKSIEFRP